MPPLSLHWLRSRDDVLTEQPPYAPAREFGGGRLGCLFKRGRVGVGYYRDDQWAEAEAVEALLRARGQVWRSARRVLRREAPAGGALPRAERVRRGRIALRRPASGRDPAGASAGKRTASWRRRHGDDGVSRTSPPKAARRRSWQRMDGDGRGVRMASEASGPEELVDVARQSFGVDATTGRPSSPLYRRLARKQHWRKCPRCAAAVETCSDDLCGTCPACGLDFRWVGALVLVRANSLDQLLQEFEWRYRERVLTHGYADSSAVAQRYWGSRDSLLQCTRCAWLKLQAWRIVVSVPLVLALLPLTLKQQRRQAGDDAGQPEYSLLPAGGGEAAGEPADWCTLHMHALGRGSLVLSAVPEFDGREDGL